MEKLYQNLCFCSDSFEVRSRIDSASPFLAGSILVAETLTSQPRHSTEENDSESIFHNVLKKPSNENEISFLQFVRQFSILTINGKLETIERFLKSYKDISYNQG